MDSKSKAYWIKRKSWNYAVCSECSFETRIEPDEKFPDNCPNCNKEMELDPAVRYRVKYPTTGGK